ncbi:MAG: antibiotic biosynthesis monooxygenase [Hyphomicrobiales bacterium]|uniref:putative quinol monooxygenase n=1 Tax=Rhabdaerophilum calidifontis TaxID=2604328 RepID=UPI00123BB17F|nr:putative quinol monooxygenase [Rhabdaerophilum calidifontis]MCA1952526.1 antibiotic biosynthesis monooxygenase [Hyphomicrobiales bacterium]MCA1999793.1 antibiotic biosynthesis monooxygenase [Hyphomicrobiales bacterium]
MSRPVIVIARVRIRPEARTIFLDALRICIAETRREAGCIRYDMHESVTDPDHFVFVEEWRDRAAIDAHMIAAHFRTTMSIAAPCLAEPPVVEGIEGGDRWRIM